MLRRYCSALSCLRSRFSSSVRAGAARLVRLRLTCAQAPSTGFRSGANYPGTNWSEARPVDHFELETGTAPMFRGRGRLAVARWMESSEADRRSAGC